MKQETTLQLCIDLFEENGIKLDAVQIASLQAYQKQSIYYAYQNGYYDGKLNKPEILTSLELAKNSTMKSLLKYIIFINQEKIKAMIYCGQGFN